MIDLDALATALVAAHRGGPCVPAALLSALHPCDAYGLQDAVLARIGAVGGWKVGARGPVAEPHSAPLPQSGLRPSGCMLPAARFPWRLVEVEVAVRLGADLHVGPNDQPTPDELAASIDAVLPAIEAVEGRLCEGREAPAIARLADLQLHGALVIGAPAALAPASIDLRAIEAVLEVGGACIARVMGGNPAQEIWRLLGWLARHCTERGMPLKRGQIVTTGSCTGMVAVPADQRVRGHLNGIGGVELTYASANPQPPPSW